MFRSLGSLVISATLGLSGSSLAYAGEMPKVEYNAMLKRADARITIVEATAQKRVASSAPRERVKASFLAWARTETQLGKSFRSISPPARAAKANDLLARGEIAFGSELAQAAAHLPSNQRAIAPYLQRTLGHAKGAGMIDRALSLLKKAGYA